MAPRRKRGQENAWAPPETPIAWTLPADLMLEILARSDHRTLVRCAATCNLLRHDILSPGFIRRVRQAAPYILANLCADADKPPVLVHPCTPAASSFLGHLSLFMSRHTVGVLDHYSPVTSRHGLVLLRRLNTTNRSKSDRCFDLCVYDPMSGTHVFFSKPPKIQVNGTNHKYVLLTAADGINCSFLLLVIDPYGQGMKVQTASSCGTWGPLRYVGGHGFPWSSLQRHGDPAILRGGVIHWLASLGILSYNLGTGKSASMKLPCTNYSIYDLHLATSSDGKQLKLIGIEGFMMSMWLQLPNSEGGDGGWATKTVINMEKKLWSLDPNIPPNFPYIRVIHCVEKRSCNVVLLRVQGEDYFSIVILDLENKDMYMQKWGPLLLEIDLPSRLENMKIFS